MSKRKPLSDILRGIIRDSGQTIGAIARGAGIPPPVLHRFVAGKDLRILTVDKLAIYLDLELRRRPAREKPADVPSEAAEQPTQDPTTH